MNVRRAFGIAAIGFVVTSFVVSAALADGHSAYYVSWIVGEAMFLLVLVLLMPHGIPPNMEHGGIVMRLVIAIIFLSPLVCQGISVLIFSSQRSFVGYLSFGASAVIAVIGIFLISRVSERRIAHPR